MYKISLSFKYEGKQYSFEFDNRVNIVTGLSATGKSFIQQSTTGIHLADETSTQIYYVDGQP
ncbi:MAG: hypothetical protein RSC68_30700, partial [Acinetobacter sp.]